ncbi:protein EARLY-RESPONSIVE TO DEHYDRATION 7, chloroplastic-like [Andrographis paniculata]|uniref:protein EARLY-RESPONSIVE TO DEHYDRATION 7, chloroplastic-like n=1 Tax=Andrographis paniculata TaxID=175694 RepID=UPI0021E938B3|nr:protein EARLY-RESPONSIVE TO DEHYDRATION 7, chloroplastic-like [Andrographis paniculata]
MASQSPPAADSIHDNDNEPPSSSAQSQCTTMKDLLADFFSDSDDETSARSPTSSPPASLGHGETLVTISGAILHLIDKSCSVELATGDLRVVRLRQGGNTVATLASVADDVHWPLGKDITAVKLDSSHYFFSFQAPRDPEDDDEENDSKKNKEKEKGKNSKHDKIETEVLSYGLTIASKGQEKLIKELDHILEECSHFSVQKVDEKAAVAMGGAAGISAGELDENKEEVEGQCAAYWTTLAPNVEDYSSIAAKLIAVGSGQLVRGILWCGDVTIERLNWGNEVLKQRMGPGTNRELDPKTLKRIKRVKKVTKITEKVATGVLSGVVKVSGFFTSSVSNSTMGKKFFNLLPGEVVLASLDGFSKLCDAVEVAGKKVMTTSSTVTTDLVTHRYGEDTAKAASEGLEAAGHAVGTAWAVFQIRRGFNPRNAITPANLSRNAAEAAAEIRKKKAHK